MQAEQERVSIEKPIVSDVVKVEKVDDFDSEVCKVEDEKVIPDDPKVLVAIESLVLRVCGMSHSLCEAEIKKFEDSIQYWFLTLPETNEYKFFRKRLTEARKHKISCPIKSEPTSNCKSEGDESNPAKKRRSRWDEKGNEPETSGATKNTLDGSLASAITLAKAAAAAAKTQGVNTSNPNQFTGGVVLTPEQAEQIRYQKELQAMQEFILAQKRSKSKEEELMAHCEGGTWEHKLRNAEMEATREWAQKLTEMGHGKHHIGDFLPPDELERFMETFRALKEGREPDYSEYKQFKLTCENGILNPVDKGNVLVEGVGLGIDRPSKLVKEDDEYDAYRKRMMLAYRFRPNPLNNPRRDYY
ncbi:unnamed protein product [Heterobilharzia americana]|nr:unnamed protein product [Heterobilharzia americana]